MKRYLVKEETLTEILKYFATRPYAEVYKLVPQIQLPAIEEVKEETKVE